MNTFEKWQNKEISDRECLRELNKQNMLMAKLLKEIDEHVLTMPYEFSHYKNRIAELLK